MIGIGGGYHGLGPWPRRIRPAHRSTTCTGLSRGLRWSFALALGATVLATLALAAGGQTPPPSSGDWVIADSTALANTTVALDGDLRVVAGGSLTLDGVTVVMSGPSPGGTAVRIDAGGRLSATASAFTAADLNVTYRFEVHGDMTLEGSVAEYMWGDAAAGLWGVQVHGGNASILNSTLRHGTGGNLLVRGADPVIRGSTFSNARFAVAEENVGPCGGDISLAADGAQFEGGAAPVVEGNRFVHNGDTVNFTDPWMDYFLAYSNASACGGFFFLDERFLSHGLEVDGSAPEAFGNTYAWNGGLPGNGSEFFIVNGTFVGINRYGFHRGDWTSAFFERIGAGLYLNASRGNFSSETVHNNTGYGVRANSPNTPLSWFAIEDTRSATASGGAAVGVGTGVHISNSTFARNGNAFRFYGDCLVYVADVTVGSFTSAPAVMKVNEFGVIRFFRTPLLSSVPLEMHGFGRTAIEFYDSPIDLANVRNVGASATLRVFWQLDVSARWTTGVPITAAPLSVTNQSGDEQVSAVLDLRGETSGLWVMQIERSTDRGVANGSTNNSRLFATLTVGGVNLGPVEFAFTGNTFLALVFQDPFPPTLTVLAPVAGQVIPVSSFALTGYAYDLGSGLAGLRYTVDRGDTWVAYTGPLPVWSVELTLPDGIHDIWVEAEDLDDHTTRVVLDLITVDTRPPVITVTDPVLPAAPPFEVAINQSAYQVRGTVSEVVNLTLNGEPADFQGTSFAILLSFGDGRNTIELTAVDVAGHITTLRFVVVVDTTPPLLVLNPPGPALLTNRSILNLRIDVDPEASLTVNGQAVAFTGSTALVPLVLSEGENEVVAVAVDPAGNRAVRTLTATLDSVAPTLSVTSPAPGTPTASPSVTVEGELSEAQCAVWVGGVRAEVDGAAFSATLLLPEGTHNISVEAVDVAGNSAAVTLTLTVDRTPPSILLTSPAARLTNGTAAVVAGTAAGAARVWVDGQEVALEGAAFSLEVPLGEGENEFTVRAVDMAGNEATEVVRLEADRTPPQLQLEGASSRTTTSTTVEIRGTAAGAASVTVNGVLYAPQPDGTFVALVPLSDGSNLVVVEAVDAAGNRALEEVTVQRVRGTAEAPAGLDVAAAAILVLVAAAASFVAGWAVSRRAR